MKVRVSDIDAGLFYVSLVMLLQMRGFFLFYRTWRWEEAGEK